MLGLQLDAADEKGRKSAQQQVERQVGRLNNFSKELDNLRAMPPPKIEVNFGHPVQTCPHSDCSSLVHHGRVGLQCLRNSGRQHAPENLESGNLGSYWVTTQQQCAACS